MFAASVSESPHEPFLVDSVEYYLLVSLFDSYNIHSPSSIRFPEGDFHLDFLSLHRFLLSSCRSLHVLASAARVGVSDDNWRRH